MKNSRGFTLIELVVVIIILAILAAVALPRFISVTDDAHESAVRGTGGALASAVLLVRSQWEVNRSTGVANPNLNVAGFGEDNVDVNSDGWPVGIDDGAAVGSVADCQDIWNNILQGSAPTLGGATPDYVATLAGQVCTYTYQGQGLNDTIVYDADKGTVTTNYTL